MIYNGMKFIESDVEVIRMLSITVSKTEFCILDSNNECTE